MLTKTSFLKCDINYGAPIIVLVGFIFSFWTNAIFFLGISVAGPFSPRYDHGDDLIYVAINRSHFLIVAASSAAFLWGVKKPRKDLIMQWIYTKLAECAFLVSGTIMLCANSRRHAEMIPVGIMLLVLAWYLIICVRRGYREIPEELVATNRPTAFSSTILQVETDKPPKYENAVQQGTI